MFDHVHTPGDGGERGRATERERESERDLHVIFTHDEAWSICCLRLRDTAAQLWSLELSLFDSSLSIHKCSVVSTVGTCMSSPSSLHISVSCCHERGGLP